MNNLNEFREVTEKALYGLTADDSLKHRILQQTAQESVPPVRRPLSLISVCGAVLAILLIAVVALNNLQPVSPATPGEINVFTAGSETASAPSAGNFIPLPLERDITAEMVTSVSVAGHGTVNDSALCSRLFSILQEKSVSAEIPDASAQAELDIFLSNGTVIHFDIEEPCIIGDNGCWSCPDFFVLLHQLLTDN